MKMDRKKLTGVIIFAGIFLVLTGWDKNSTHYEDKLTRESNYFDGELYSYKEYEYNVDGLLEKMTEYEADGDFCSSVVYEYDDGLLINESLYYDQNDPYEVIKRKYDSKGRLVKEKYYHGIFVSKKNKYYYNHKGLLKKEKNGIMQETQCLAFLRMTNINTNTMKTVIWNRPQDIIGWDWKCQVIVLNMMDMTI